MIKITVYQVTELFSSQEHKREGECELQCQPSEEIGITLREHLAYLCGSDELKRCAVTIAMVFILYIYAGLRSLSLKGPAVV